MLSGTGAGLSPPHALYRNHGHLHFHLAAALLLLWCCRCKWCRNSSNKQWKVVTVRVQEEFSAPFARASAKRTRMPQRALAACSRPICCSRAPRSAPRQFSGRLLAARRILGGDALAPGRGALSRPPRSWGLARWTRRQRRRSCRACRPRLGSRLACRRACPPLRQL